MKSIMFIEYSEKQMVFHHNTNPEYQIPDTNTFQTLCIVKNDKSKSAMKDLELISRLTRYVYKHNSMRRNKPYTYEQVLEKFKLLMDLKLFSKNCRDMTESYFKHLKLRDKLHYTMIEPVGD